MSQTTMSNDSLPTPMVTPAAPRMLCVSIHDVAPATWADCQRLVQAVRAVADIPLTFLVVPHYHFRPERSAGMEAGLDAAQAHGDELALHGYSHLDTEANQGGLRSRFLRSVYTRREGEFAALDEAEARRRLALGLDWFAERGWTPSGFIPPAWLLGSGAWRALRGAPFSYTTTFSHFHCLPEPQETWQRPAPMPTPAPDQDQERQARRDRRSRFDASRRGDDDAQMGGRQRQGGDHQSGAHAGAHAGSHAGAHAGSMGLQAPASGQGQQGQQGQQGHYDGGSVSGARPEWLGRSARTKEAERHEQREQQRRAYEQSRQSQLIAQSSQYAQRDGRDRRDRRDQQFTDDAIAAARAGTGIGTQADPCAHTHVGVNDDAARIVTSAAGGIITRPGKAILSPSLVYAARNRGGRIVSPRVADITAAMLAQSPLVRFSLHPPDARYPELVRHLQTTLARLLEHREPVTKAECARRLSGE